MRSFNQIRRFSSILSDVDDIVDSDESFCLATYGAVPGTGEEPETYPTTTRLGAALAQNQQTYDAALAAVAAEYREDLRVAENDWRLAALDAYADEETSLTTALLARKSSLATDYGTYLTALSVAATQYSERVNLNDQVYSIRQEGIMKAGDVVKKVKIHNKLRKFIKRKIKLVIMTKKIKIKMMTMDL